MAASLRASETTSRTCLEPAVVNYLSVSVFPVFPPDNFYVDDFARFSALDSRGKTAAIANSMNYLTKKGNPLGLDLVPHVYSLFSIYK